MTSSAEQGPRVAVAFHEVILGGATRSVLRSVPLLEERGWRFSFWAPRPSELYDHLEAGGWDVDGAPRCIEYSLRTWRLPPGPVRRLLAAPGYLRHYRRFLQSRRPALVHANSILSLAEALVASRSGLPTLLHAHEMLPLDLRGRMLRNAAWRNLDQIVAVSETSGARLDWRGRRPRIVHEATPIPEPVEPRERPEPFTVGTVAVVSKRKGSDLFVEAARRLQSRNGTSYRFEMVGSESELIDREWAREVLAQATAAGIEHVPSADVFERMRQLGRLRAAVALGPVPALDARGDGKRPSGRRHPPGWDRRADHQRHRAAGRARGPGRARRRNCLDGESARGHPRQDGRRRTRPGQPRASPSSTTPPRWTRPTARRSPTAPRAVASAATK